ncbi:hypothetical protein niasHT_015003 [Heterodera trifolii]|uniref:Uncharacterized protein n=1 Tax=Heterodera trifolii TaxID=157864 RepID=A0ABD2L0T9_9BILA
MYDIILKNDKTPDLGTLMRAIVMEIGPVTSPDLFHSYVIAHVSTMTAKACVVPVGLSFSQFTNYSGYSMIRPTVTTDSEPPTTNVLNGFCLSKIEHFCLM